MNNNEQLFLTAAEVATIMSVSLSKGYKVIHELNNELKRMGYLTVSGRVSKKYFDSKVFGRFEVQA